MMRGLSRKIISAGIVLFAVAVMTPMGANAQNDLRAAAFALDVLQTLADTQIVVIGQKRLSLIHI